MVENIGITKNESAGAADAHTAAKRGARSKSRKVSREVMVARQHPL